MIDFSRSYASSFELRKVDRRSWGNAEHVPNMVDASIARDTGQLLESGSITLMADKSAKLDSGYYRLVMHARQGSANETFDVATLHCVRTSGSMERGSQSVTLTGTSVLAPAYHSRMALGSYVPANESCVEYCKEVLSSVLDAPVVSSGTFSLKSNYVFDFNARVLDAAHRLLRMGAYSIRILGDGTVSLEPTRSDVSLSLTESNARMLMPDSAYERDIGSIPNCYAAIYEDRLYKVVNDNPDSVVSTASVGYVKLPDGGIDMNPNLLSDESIETYCRRKLTELSVFTETRTYRREYADGVMPGDIVQGSQQTVGYDGPLQVMTQSLNCSHGIVVTEKSAVKEQLWQ